MAPPPLPGHDSFASHGSRGSYGSNSRSSSSGGLGTGDNGSDCSGSSDGLGMMGMTPSRPFRPTLEGPNEPPPLLGYEDKPGKVVGAYASERSVRSKRGATKDSAATSMTKGSDASRRTSGESQRNGADGNGKQDFLTHMETPEWIELILSATGISYLTFKIEKERERRSGEYFIQPFPNLHGAVTSVKFEVVIGFAIFLNCVLIGWEASLEDDSDDGLNTMFSVGEHIFVLFFFAEWCLRILACGWVWIFELLNFCDTVLVFGTGVLVKWVMEPMGAEVGFLRIFTVMRALRLARLARSVRLIPFFKELWILIHGLTESARPLLWTFVIALILLYVFAVAATELIGRREMFQDDEHVQERFGNLLRSMFTMFQLMTMDSWGFDIARPAMERDSALGVFFVAFVGIAVFIFWNLITAIIVENAFSIAKNDHAHQAKETENQKKKELKVLADLFLQIDRDGSGELTIDEFFSSLQNKKVKQMLDLLEVKVSEMEEVWNTLDDGDGLLTIKEFTTGMRRMKGEAQAKDVLQSIKQLRHTSLSQMELKAQVDQFGSKLVGLESRVKKITGDTGEVVGLFQEMHHRLSAHVERLVRQQKVATRQREKALKNQEEAEALEEVEREDEEDGSSFMQARRSTLADSTFSDYVPGLDTVPGP